MAVRPETWLKPTPLGLHCAAGDFYVDPLRPVKRAVITHGHADHARLGHGQVLATPETLAIMKARWGEGFAGSAQALPYGERVTVGGFEIRLLPAGHVLGSAQAVVEKGGARLVVSGDYKRRFDPTCPPFEVVRCNVFITEATFGLPVFRHPPDGEEVAKLLHSRTLFPERCHLVGVYALGKAQRLLKLLRLAGYDRPIWLHGALRGLTSLYESFGIDFGALRAVAGTPKEALRGEIVLAPPSVFGDRWSRRLPDPLPAMASGWMRVRARARQRGAELPLVISDHADWDELMQTIGEVEAERVWVTHGREEAILHCARSRGISAEALSLTGYEEEDEEVPSAAEGEGEG